MTTTYPSQFLGDPRATAPDDDAPCPVTFWFRFQAASGVEDATDDAADARDIFAAYCAMQEPFTVTVAAE